MKKVFLCLIAITALYSCKDEHSNLSDGLYADIKTNKGDIIVQLEFEKAPITVANFVSLAEGKNTFVSNDYKGKDFYNGLKFHRVVDHFMIQGGDPMGDGTGDAGYKFKDEITDLNFDKGGVLAMANSGPGGTNGSQFFITHNETPFLYGKHSVFGHVVEKGMDVVNKIAQGDDIVTVTIIRKGNAAKKFDAVKVFTDYFAHEAENQKKQALVDAENKKLYDAKYKAVKEQKVAYFEDIKKSATKSGDGLLYKIISKGKGTKPAAGTNVYIHYSGFLENGELFDTSVESVAQAFGKFNPQRAAARQYLPIPFQYGAKDGMIPGFIEGIEKMSIGDKAVIIIPPNLGYGAQGAGGVIPPNSTIIFELELLEAMPK